MSVRSIAATEAYEPDASALKPAVHVLERQLANTLELAACVDRLRADLNDELGGKLPSLFEGLFNELDGCCGSLRNRIESFAPHLRQAPRTDAPGHSDWRLFADGSDCRECLESLLNRYARYARTSSDSAAKLELLGDLASARIVGRAVAAAEKGLWFIEAYMEAIALRTDGGRLPDWPRAGV